MSVELSPANQLGFQRPLTKQITRNLLIHNPHPHPVAFKVKTTAPKQYCVRPNSGRVEGGESVQVQVMMQPLTTEPPPHAKCKDKFLVQSAFITPDEEMHSLGDMWASTEKTNKAAIKEQKIKVAYLAAEDGTVPGANGIPEENEDATVGDVSRLEESQIYTAAQSSPLNHTTPARDAPVPSPPQTASPVAPIGAQTDTKPIPSLSAEQIQLAGPSPTNAALERGLTSTTSEGDKVKALTAEIERLRAQLAEAQGPTATGLRKRGGQGGVGAGAETAVEKAKEVVHGQSGVPLEVVVGVAVGVFVLTYLFF